MRDADEKSETKPDQSKSSGFIGTLGSWGLTALGLLYVMGYIIVNGYATNYFNYAATAVNLKHLSAGLLYVLLTLFQILLVAFFLLDLVDQEAQSGKGRRNKRKPKPVKTESESVSQRKGPWNRAKTIFLRKSKPDKPESELVSQHKGPWNRAKTKFLWIWRGGTALFSAYFVTYLFIGLIGIAQRPQYGGRSLIMSCLPWIGINLAISVAVAVAIYLTAKADREAFQNRLRPPRTAATQRPVSEEEIKELEQESMPGLFIRALGGRWLALPLFLFALVYLSLISFQRVYGYLRPDYGGGALYRVAVALAPVATADEKATGTQTAAENPAETQPPASSQPVKPSGLMDEVRRKLESKDSWRLFVDRDSNFVYLLCVDAMDHRSLLAVSLSEIKALEVLSSGPIHPADACWLIREEQERATTNR
jgi:hypothetical protein